MRSGVYGGQKTPQIQREKKKKKDIKRCVVKSCHRNKKTNGSHADADHAQNDRVRRTGGVDARAETSASRRDAGTGGGVRNALIFTVLLLGGATSSSSWSSSPPPVSSSGTTLTLELTEAERHRELSGSWYLTTPRTISSKGCCSTRSHLSVPPSSVLFPGLSRRIDPTELIG